MAIFNSYVSLPEGRLYMLICPIGGFIPDLDAGCRIAGFHSTSHSKNEGCHGKIATRKSRPKSLLIITRIYRCHTMMSTIVYHVDWDLDPLCPQPRLAKVAARRPRAAENALGRPGG